MHDRRLAEQDELDGNELGDREIGGSVEHATEPFLGRWNRLVSTTNWDKGRIIQEWREALSAADVPPGEYSDEAWSQRVGNVSSQHVGRLRRVYERFAASRDTFAGLYWSHFQAGLDWDDAEMWLEGAVHSRWSIAEMRRQRWQTLGSVGESPDADAANAELDEDQTEGEGIAPWQTQPDTFEIVDHGGARDSSDDDAADRETSNAGGGSASSRHNDDSDEPVARARSTSPESMPVRPFAELAELPADLSEAFESFKLAILHHKLARWQEITCADVLASLDALKQLATAPSDE